MRFSLPARRPRPILRSQQRSLIRTRPIQLASPNLSIISLTAKLNATYYGAGSNYTSSSLAYYADSAIKSYSNAQLASGESVSSVLIDTIGMNSNGLGQFSNVSSASITFTPYVNSFGKATFTGTAVTNKNNRFAITFSIPVTPVPVNSFDSQTAEPISTSSVNTSYKGVCSLRLHQVLCSRQQQQSEHQSDD